MLSHLSVRDFAIIDAVDVAFPAGMTVLTGETGAGKSILLDALSLVLGDRADSTVVRHGAVRADINAAFDTRSMPGAESWLRINELDADGECLLRRVISADGRSRSYINGRPVPLQSLRELGEHLVDIHGQHEHQSLLREAVQRELLDGFGELQALATQTASAHGAWRQLAEDVAALRSATGKRDERLELLRYQVSELTALAPRAGELPELEQAHFRLANAERFGETLQGLVRELFEDEQSLHDRLSRRQSEMQTLAAQDPRYAPMCELLEGARIHVDEAATEARDQLEQIETDPAALREVEQRLGALHELARKHRIDAEALPAQLQNLAAELDELEHADSRLAEREQALAQRLADYRRHATALSDARHQAAARLGAAVTAAMQSLGMPGGQFRVDVDSDADAAPAPHGRDIVRFQVSANPGQPPRPLRKVASGGELSRISLAIQMVVTGAARIPTLIFDEVDAGIGGATAEIVGQRLAALGASFQVLCVTHLAQVAAQAGHHLQITKIAGDNTARTRVRELAGQERVNEIARMLGGVELTPQSLAHAEAIVQPKP